MDSTESDPHREDGGDVSGRAHIGHHAECGCERDYLGPPEGETESDVISRVDPSAMTGGAPSVACPAGMVGIGTTALPFDLGGSLWRAAHWGWMPARE